MHDGSLFFKPSGPSTVYLAIYPDHSHARVVSAFERHRRTRDHHAAFTTVTRGTTTSTSSTTNATRYPERSQPSSKSYQRSSRPVFPNPAPTYELEPDASYFRDPRYSEAPLIPDPDGIAEGALHDTHRRLYHDTLHFLLLAETAIPDFYHRAQFAVFKMKVDPRLWDAHVLAAFNKFGHSGSGLSSFPVIAAEFHEEFLSTLTNEKAEILDFRFFEWVESETDPSVWARPSRFLMACPPSIVCMPCVGRLVLLKKEKRTGRTPQGNLKSKLARYSLLTFRYPLGADGTVARQLRLHEV